MPRNIRESISWREAYQQGFQDGLERARQAAEKISDQDRLDLELDVAARKAFDDRALDRLLMLLVNLRLASGLTLKEIAAQLNMTVKEAPRPAKGRERVPSRLPQ